MGADRTNLIYERVIYAKTARKTESWGVNRRKNAKFASRLGGRCQ